jgi:hypothetical protein
VQARERGDRRGSRGGVARRGRKGKGKKKALTAGDQWLESERRERVARVGRDGADMRARVAVRGRERRARGLLV